MTDPAPKSLLQIYLPLLALVWLLFVAWRTWLGWPALPLDLDAGDPATQAAFAGAQTRHLALAALWALAPLVVLCLVIWLSRPTRPG